MTIAATGAERKGVSLFFFAPDDQFSSFREVRWTGGPQAKDGLAPDRPE
jgi:hypothetical protein